MQHHDFTATAQMCGATVLTATTAFKVWAPKATSVAVVFEGAAATELPLSSNGDGHFVGSSSNAPPGTRYRLRLNDATPLPDPYSRFQPDGPHGPSMVIDPGSFAWTDADWRGLTPQHQVIYELHVGTFTPGGTFEDVSRELASLRELGVTCIELMPVGEFAGSRGWGYDGVDFFAPYHHYGDPDSLRRLVDTAHSLGLGVILDVVYNHVGGEGNYLPHFSDEYFTEAHGNEWGQAFNYAVDPVRRLAIDNAAYWIREFHMDGLRLDATQGMHDPDYPHLFAELTDTCRAAARGRSIILSAEDYLQRADLLVPTARGGAGFDYLWNDDFHHASRVTLTGGRDGYFRQYRGSAQELLSTMKRGFLFQGQFDTWCKAPRGSSTRGRPASAFIVFIQNHDQVANTLYGERIHKLTSPARLRALTAALLLGPGTPLLFMGQEYSSDSVFAYFADYSGKVAQDLWAARRKALRGFAQYAGAEAQGRVLDPTDQRTFARSVLKRRDGTNQGQVYKLHQDLLSLRASAHVLASAREFDGAVLNDHAFLARWFDDAYGDRLLLVNLGAAFTPTALSEPLLAPLPGTRWELLWSSNDPGYGGMGSTDPLAGETLRLPAEVTCFLRLVSAT